MNVTIRRKPGSALILFICVTCCVILPILILSVQCSSLSLVHARVQDSVEAACLLAARDASRVIIDDPRFGYVSLSNYPPIGKGTTAPDGEPLPVLGINTLIATIRQNMVIADLLENETMKSLAEEDRTCLQDTIERLNSHLYGCLTNGNKNHYFDIDKSTVNPIDDVTSFLKNHLPSGAKCDSIKLSNGWLCAGGRTAITVAQPERLAQVEHRNIQLNEYKPFINIPAAGKSFTFAGIGNTPSLCNPANFRAADDKHICSMIKVECLVTVTNLFPWLWPWDKDSSTALTCTACAEPYSNPDISPPGVMTLRFPQGSVPGIRSWHDLLADTSFSDNQLSTYDVIGGDYPVDDSARMVMVQSNVRLTTAQCIAEHLYCWLRNGHVRPHIDAVLAMAEDHFLPGTTGRFYIYEFAQDGSIFRRTPDNDPFPVGVTSDSQCSIIADTRLRSGSPAIIIFRNNVRHLGIIFGGKHAGQPLPGYPLDWCELQAFGGDDWLASMAAKGKLGTKLILTNPNTSIQGAEMNYDLFQTLAGKKLARQPRRTYYSGGLALDIEIGGTGLSNPIADVTSMRSFCARRKI